MGTRRRGDKSRGAKPLVTTKPKTSKQVPSIALLLKEKGRGMRSEKDKAICDRVMGNSPL
jgi:hypothetical protein